MIRDENASAHLKEVLRDTQTPHGTVDNVMRVHSLRPSTMKGHFYLYKSVLHDPENSLPTWFQETLSSYVSILNKCEYSLANHWANACHLIGNLERINDIKSALDTGDLEKAFKGTELAILRYAEKLTKTPNLMKKSDVDNLKELKISDGEILEANQIICYFNYVNRTINGLGVSTTGDTVGYYKSNSKS